MTVAANTDYGLLIDGEEHQVGEVTALWDPSTGAEFGSARLGRRCRRRPGGGSREAGLRGALG